MSQRVDLSTAKKLKSMGYSIPCDAFYLDRDLTFVKSGLKYTKNGEMADHNRWDECIYSAPTIEQYQDWKMIGHTIEYPSSIVIKISPKD